MRPSPRPNLRPDGTAGAFAPGASLATPASELIELAQRRPAWWADARCRLPAFAGVDFFADTIDQAEGLAVARQVCSGCPVRSECAEAGSAERGGVWGGLTPGERRKARMVSSEEGEIMRRGLSKSRTSPSAVLPALRSGATTTSC